MNVGTRPGIKSFLLLILIAVLATASVVRAQNGVAGKWRSVAEGPGGKVVLILQLQQDGTGRWTGSAKNSREPDRIRELQQLDVQGADVSFHIDTEVPNQGITVRSKFLLRFRDTHDTLKGTIEVTAPGMQREMPMQFDRVVERAGADATSFQADRPMIGAWSARPDKDDKLRELQVELLPDAENNRGTLSDTSIDETVALRDLVIRDTSISFKHKSRARIFQLLHKPPRSTNSKTDFLALCQVFHFPTFDTHASGNYKTKQKSFAFIHITHGQGIRFVASHRQYTVLIVFYKFFYLYLCKFFKVSHCPYSHHFFITTY